MEVHSGPGCISFKNIQLYSELRNDACLYSLPPPAQCSMPSCIVAFHVTCAFDHNLEMRTILAENDEVRFKSFCLEHSCTAGNSVSNGNHAVPTANGAHASTHDQAPAGLCSALRPHGGDGEQRAASYPVSVSAAERAERDQLEREKVSLRKQKLQELEDEFYRLVDPREVAENLELPVFQVQKPPETQ